MSNILYGDIDGSEHIVYNNSDVSGHMITGIYSACNSKMAGYCPINSQKGIWYFTERYNTRGGGFLSGEVADFTASPIDSILKIGFHSKDEFEQKTGAGTNRLSISNSKAPDKAHAMLILKMLFDSFANDQTVWLTFDSANLSDSAYISMCLGYLRRIITVLPSKVQPLVSFACNITTMNLNGFNAALSVISPKYLPSLGSNAAQITNMIINCDRPLGNIPPCDEFTQTLAVVAAGVPDIQKKAFFSITNTMDHLIKFDVLIRKHSDAAMLNTLYRYANIYNQFYATRDKTKEVVQRFLSALFQIYVRLRNFESFDYQSDPYVKQFEPEYLKIVKAKENSQQRPPQQTQQPKKQQAQHTAVRQPEPVQEQQPKKQQAQHTAVRQPEPVKEQQPADPTPVYENDDDLDLIRNEQNAAKIYGKKYNKIQTEIGGIDENITNLQNQNNELERKISELEAEIQTNALEINYQNTERSKKTAEAEKEKKNIIKKYSAVYAMACDYDSKRGTDLKSSIVEEFISYGLDSSLITEQQPSPQPAQPTQSSQTTSAASTSGSSEPQASKSSRSKRNAVNDKDSKFWNPTNDSPATNFNYNAIFPTLNPKSPPAAETPPADTKPSGSADTQASKYSPSMELLDTAIDDMSTLVNNILHSENYRLSVDTNNGKVDPNSTSLSLQQWDAHISGVFTAKDGISTKPFEFHTNIVYDNFKNQFYYRFTRGNDIKGLKKDFQVRTDQLFDEARQLTIFLLVDELCNYYYADANPIGFNYINRDMKHATFIIKRPYLFYLAEKAIEYMKSDYLGDIDRILNELTESITQWENEDDAAYKYESPNADVSPFAEIFFAFVLYIANGFTFSMLKAYSVEGRAAIQDVLLNNFLEFKLYDKVYKAARYIKVDDNFENELAMRTLWIFPKKFPADKSEMLLPKLLEKCRKYS